MLQVALLQISAHAADQEANRRTGDAWCRKAKALGADIALFPEMWNIGYTAYAGCPNLLAAVGREKPVERAARVRWQAQAVGRSDPFVTHFQRLAAELDMAIAVTYLERWPGGAPRNTVSLIDRRGEIAFTYAKVHTCDFDMEAACTPGEDFYVAPLRTAHDTVDVGAMICFDREFPESARILMLKGAELVLVPNACEMEANRLSQLGARAFENMMGVALANYPAPQQNGRSVAFDGIAFTDEGRSRDMCVAAAGEEEGIYLARFDLDVLRTYRAREVWGNAFRRPHRYAPLASMDVRVP
ncbi:MAG TPA: carbon-nitrogen hydrolase family protein [bacterium]|nr:carbon-nitrogen hydrolase family protein [bacterium]